MKPIEFFATNKEVYAIIDGRVTQFEELQLSTMDIIRADLDKNPEACQALQHWGLSGVAELKQYVKCRYGAFNTTPDLSDKGADKETFQCGNRNKCPYEGKLCNKMLTPTEREVTKLIAQDLADKQIADLRGKSVRTIENQRRSIQHKIGAHSKVGIAVHAINNQIT